MSNARRYLYFSIWPFCSCLFIIIDNKINTINEFLPLLAYVGIYFLFTIISFKIFDKIEITLNKVVISILTLVTFDQFIKIIVDRYFKDGISIINSVFNIKIHKNYNQMAMLNYFDVEISRVWVVVMKVICILLVFTIYNVMRKKLKSKNIKLGLIFLGSGSIANLLDTICWGYTLDYMLFVNIMTYDLKDFYVDIGVSFIIYEIITYYMELDEIERKRLSEGGEING